MPIVVGRPPDKPNPAPAGQAAGELGPSATTVMRASTLDVTASALPARPPVPQVPIPPEATETADELFARLRQLCAEGRVAIDLNNKRLMHIDSPVSFEAWGNQWVYPLLILTCAIWWWFGWKVGTGAAVASVLLYLTLGKSFLHRRIERRVREQVLEDVVRWRKLWSFGGVSLHCTGDGAGNGICASPGDNWMEFVRRLTKNA
jgi:hypothetical protein